MNLEGKKEGNYKAAIKSRDCNALVNSAMPIRVFISTTNKCNMNCSMCPNFYKLERGEELPFSIFKTLASELFPAAIEYHTTVAGEPLLTSYFKRIPSILQEYGVRLNLTTNGMLLSSEISNLIMPVLRDVKISFDGAKKSTFENIRKGANYELILDNIKEFIRLRDKYVSRNKTKKDFYRPTITLQTVLMKDNIKELPDIVKIAYKFGVDRVKAYFMVVYTHKLVNHSLWFYKKTANYYIKKAEDLAIVCGIKTKFPKKFGLGWLNKDRVKGAKITCHFLWQEGWIEPNGDVIPCCACTILKLGNILKNPFSEIWNNNEYQEMRRRLNSQNPFECCRNCMLVHEFRNETNWDYSKNSLIQIKRKQW